MNYPLTIFQSQYVDSKRLVDIKLFWWGFILYGIGSAITLEAFEIIFQLIQVAGLGLLFMGGHRLVPFQFDNAYVAILFKVYFLWLMLVFVRGVSLDYDEMKVYLTDPWFGAMIYFSPLLMLFPKKLAFYSTLFRVISIFGIAAIVLYAAYYQDLVNPDIRNYRSRDIVEGLSRTLAVPACFTLMTFMYHSGRRKVLAWAVVLLTIYFALIRARRGLLFMVISPLVFTYVIYLMKSRVKSLFIILSVIAGLGLINYGISVFNSSHTFDAIKQRAMQNTREGVELMFFKDMEGMDWIVGRGADGLYYCPGIEEDNESGYRRVIETDYLQIILKGGLISLILLLLIVLPAIFKGLFLSKNTLSKAAAIWILLSLINMYPSTVNTFNLFYLVFWVSVGICYSPIIRNLPDQVLIDYFSSDTESKAL